MKQPVVRAHHRRLKEVFKTDNPQMMARVIRLCVLFEDLRIEYQGAITHVEIPHLDTAGKNYRQFYFIRRSLVSMIEFSGALSRLNSLDGWEAVLDQMDPSTRKAWKDAVAYFNQHHPAWKGLRDDMGGHFLEATAEFALKKLTKSTGKLIIRTFPEEETGGAVLEFATEFVAISLRKTMTQRKATRKQQRRFLNKTFLHLTRGWKHAVGAVHVVVAEFLIERFLATEPLDN